jgi:hypothetical protein
VVVLFIHPSRHPSRHPSILGELKNAYTVGGQVMSGIIMGSGGWLNGAKGDRCGFEPTFVANPNFASPLVLGSLRSAMLLVVAVLLQLLRCICVCCLPAVPFVWLCARADLLFFFFLCDWICWCVCVCVCVCVCSYSCVEFSPLQKGFSSVCYSLQHAWGEWTVP